MLGGLYLWAGAAKLFSSGFYTHVAPAVFAPFWWFSRPASGSVVGPMIVAGCCVGLESLMGLVFLVDHMCPDWLRQCMAMFNLMMHSYT